LCFADFILSEEPNPSSDKLNMTKKKASYTIDGKPAKLQDIYSSVLNAMLKEALGDYISARDVRETRNKVGIKSATLRSWRNGGRLRAKKIGATWFYSRQDLIELIKTSKSG